MRNQNDLRFFQIFFGGLILMALASTVVAIVPTKVKTVEDVPTVHHLHQIYDWLNEDYFDGHLPAKPIIEYATLTPTKMAESWYDESGRFHIQFNPGYSHSEVYDEITMLHEACHAMSIGDLEHGQRWRACMYPQLDTAIKQILIDGYKKDLTENGSGGNLQP